MTTRSKCRFSYNTSKDGQRRRKKLQDSELPWMAKCVFWIRQSVCPNAPLSGVNQGQWGLTGVKRVVEEPPNTSRFPTRGDEDTRRGREGGKDTKKRYCVSLFAIRI